ncbi:MAG: hypothetical protein AAF721_09430 [Myxococcota bacterium]
MTSSTPPMAPRRALVHPLWLGSLAVLALNDHVLKGAGILPDFATGKISDLAGMLVAPLLLAVVLGARSRRMWLAAHAAVALVFGAIQIIPAAVTAWSAAMAAVGSPWLITPDPTDLIALPVLLVSAWFYPRVMNGSVRTHARASAEIGIAGVGVALCAATSPPPPEFVEPDLNTDTWLHNATDASVVVRIRPLKASVDADCDLLETDPGRLLSEPLFGNASSWTLESGENLSVRRGIQGAQQNEWWGDTGGEFEELPERECNVGLVDIDGVTPAIFFWRDEDLDTQSVPARGWNDDLSGGVMIEMGEDGQARLTHDDDDITFTLVTALPPTTGACAPQEEGDRVAWSDVPVGLHTLTAFDPGVDGCIRLDLGLPGVEEPLATATWYLCVPEEVFPFAAGDQVSVETIDTGISSGIRVAQQAGELAELWVYAGGLAPATKGVSFAPVPDYGCELRAEPECGTISRSSVIVAGGGSFSAAEVSAGAAPTTLEGEDGARAIVYVAHAQERVALDAECAGGPDSIGEDVEVAVAIIPAGE